MEDAKGMSVEGIAVWRLMTKGVPLAMTIGTS